MSIVQLSLLKPGILNKLGGVKSILVNGLKKSGGLKLGLSFLEGEVFRTFFLKVLLWRQTNVLECYKICTVSVDQSKAEIKGTSRWQKEK